MRSFVFAALVACISAQTFEPTDFNITEALLDNGVNITDIPELAKIAERSVLSGCSIAVGQSQLQRSAYTWTNYVTVQFLKAHFRRRSS